ncbi:MAG: hypothetical protein JWM27_1825 [Gemmatimonadetes bacterium]|nr:hypothetical protein [Gemmatimonadota bacterium]
MPLPRSVRSLVLPLLAVAAAAACHNQVVLVPASPGPPSGRGAPAHELRVMPPIPREVEGTYVLMRLGGNGLPAPGEAEPGCTVRVVSGTLTLEQGRFTWGETRERTCGGRTTVVPVRAGGGYGIDVATLRFAADSGAFTAAVGAYLGRGLIQVDGLTTPGGADVLRRDYQRRQTLR